MVPLRSELQNQSKSGVVSRIMPPGFKIRQHSFNSRSPSDFDMCSIISSQKMPSIEASAKGSALRQSTKVSALG
jgi:hypothetical protein